MNSHSKHLVSLMRCVERIRNLRVRPTKGLKAPLKWREVSPLVIVLFVCLAFMAVSCVADEVTTVGTVDLVGTDSVINNDNDRLRDDTDDIEQSATELSSAGSGSVQQVQVPDVVGLSSGEALLKLEAVGFTVAFGLHDLAESGVEHETVTASEPAAETLAPLGSQVILDVYIDNATGDEPAMTSEAWDRVRIDREVRAEFSDRIERTHWDQTKNTFYVQIANLSVSEAGELSERYTDEAFTVSFSSGTISFTQLQNLNQSVQDLVTRVFQGCGLLPYSTGIDRRSWSVFVTLSLKQTINDSDKSRDECVIDMKQATLLVAAEFVKEHSIPADPADLVRFELVDMTPMESFTDELPPDADQVPS